MKKLFTILILLISFNINAQESTESTTLSETERIVDKYSGKIAEGFTELMESATPVVKQGFEMVIRLQIAKGIAYMLVPTMCIICWFIFFKYYKIAREDKPSDWVTGKNGTIGLLFLVISISLSIGSIFATYDGLLYLIAPEWFAIKEIANLI